jgi:hypothetical protein
MRTGLGASGPADATTTRGGRTVAEVRIGESYIVEPERRVPVKAEYDVVVVGGGTAGVVAAIAAARNGARTALVERYGFLGGCLIGGATGIHSFFNIYKAGRPTERKQVVRGLPQEIVDRLTAIGGGLGHVEMREGFDFVSMLTPCEPEAYKVLAHQMCAEAGVDLLLHTALVDAFAVDGQARGLIVESKSGREAILARRIVDCSGDADAAAMLGAPFTLYKGEDNYYSVSMTFRIGNADLDRAVEFLRGKGALTQWATAVKWGGARESTVRLGANFRAWDNGWEEAGFRGWILSTSIREQDLTYANCTSVSIGDALNRDDLSYAEGALRAQAGRTVEFLREQVRGFEDAYVAATSAQTGVRRTRIVHCHYGLSREDVLKGRGFPDEVARFGFIDNSRYFIEDNGAYGIPYRALMPLEIDNLLVAGRMISTDRVVHNSTRNTASCMAQGEAAGTAAALSVRLGVTTQRLDPQALRAQLRAQGAYIEG